MAGAGRRVHLLARAVVVRAGPGGPAVLLAQQHGAAHTFLPGGHVEPGEGLAGTLRRELHEELGLACRVERYLGAVEHAWPDATLAHYEVAHCFLCWLNIHPGCAHGAVHAGERGRSPATIAQEGEAAPLVG